VPPGARNVIALHPHRRLSEDLPVPLERLGVAVYELGAFGDCIERIVDDPYWSAAEWRVACTPLMLRLPGVRQSLTELAGIRADRWPDTDWAVRLRAAHGEVERRLLDVSIAMNALIHEEPSIDVRVTFGFDGTKLAEAVDELRHLIVSRYPEAVGDI
jgi:hypothetical protein